MNSIQRGFYIESYVDLHSARRERVVLTQEEVVALLAAWDQQLAYQTVTLKVREFGVDTTLYFRPHENKPDALVRQGTVWVCIDLDGISKARDLVANGFTGE